MTQWMRYKKPLIAVGIFLLSFFLLSCREDMPPKEATGPLCSLDGFGMGYCTEVDGSHTKKLPSEMVGYIARSPDEEGAYDAWCFDTSAEKTKYGLSWYMAHKR